jgi:adenine phosphoribosyltransferase
VCQLGGEVIEAAFMIELNFLHGRKKLAPHPVFSLIQY